MPRDSLDARERLLRAALQVFAEKGYASASTREICKLADANVAAIHYYFNDKASLYREIFRGADEFRQQAPQMEDPRVPLREALVGFYAHLLAFATQPQQAQQFRMLLVREQLQPSGVLDAVRREGVTPFHGRMVQLLQQRLHVDTPDLPLQHLAFSLLGLVLVLFIEMDVLQCVAPGLISDEVAMSATTGRLADQGVALIEAERARRVQGVHKAHAAASRTPA